MRERVCSNCGGKKYRVVGQNMVKCEFCGTLYVDEHASKEEEVLVVGANDILRATRFEEAVEEFDRIISLYPMSFEAYFGKSLATNKIILYNNKKGTNRFPRFFGESINSILDDENYKKAIQLAPEDTIKTYTEQAKRIEKCYKSYEDVCKNENYDIIFCTITENIEEDLHTEINELLQKNNSVYALPDKNHKELEPRIFRALLTCKVFVLFVSGKNFSDFKHLYDRYNYFINLHKKTKSSVIIILDDGFTTKDLPKDLAKFKNVLEYKSDTFLEDLDKTVNEEISKSIKEVAKIDVVKLNKEKPQKKEYVNLESVDPTDLGHYKVENISLSDENKIKWIYLLIKNGDFTTAENLLKTELEKDEYNSELLFADLLISKNIKTEEEFCANIANYKDKTRIDRILRYASKDFAEKFVDNWENLIINLNMEEYYEEYTLYLAQYNTPNRENFIKHAELMAIETMDEELIDIVQKCFNKNDVDRFINFYYALAQKSDNQKYYDKILELDQGHEQSNLSMLIQHFKSPNDILTYRNKEELENTFKYLNDDARANFVNQIVDMVLPVSFMDLEAAENQLDFYLAYVADETRLADLAKKIAIKFQEMKFFKQAEKYISIALSKNKDNAELYWILLKIKAHCISDSEVVSSSVDFSKMPEWETLISLAKEGQIEKFAEVLSKNNLYKGERTAFAPDFLDQKSSVQKIKEFLERNEKILNEMEKENPKDTLMGVNYYRLQLKPFEKSIEKLSNSKNYEEFKTAIQNVYDRLKSLDLTLDTSINVTTLMSRNDGLKGVQASNDLEKKQYDKQIKNIKNDKFLRRFLCGFLEFFPSLFITLLLFLVIILPKEVYLYFNQNFIIGAMIVSVFLGIANAIFYFLKKKKINIKWKIANLSLFGIGIINLVLFAYGFYFAPMSISILTGNELQLFMNNAYYSNMVLEDDIDFTNGNISNITFHGTLDGNGHKITNISMAKGGFILSNHGTIKNLDLYYEDGKVISDCQTFGGVARINLGNISNCKVYGNLSFETNIDSVIGGIVGVNNGGKIDYCQNNLVISVNSSSENLTVGGFAGIVVSGKSNAIITHNTKLGNINITSNGVKNLNVGGLIGKIDRVSASISENSLSVNLRISGNAEHIYIGGLIGDGQTASFNNSLMGSITTADLTGTEGFVGGLYGRFRNTNFNDEIRYSFAVVNILGDNLKKGGLFGQFGGAVKNCFSNIDIIGDKLNYSLGDGSCLVLTDERYSQSLGFDENIWFIKGTSSYPVLKWTLE